MSSSTDSYISVANAHIKRLQFAIDNLQHKIPITATAVQNMSDQDFMYFEVLTGRFSKLQDFLGKQLIDLYLEAHKEDVADLSMIDKINKLEKLAIINSAEFWDELRQLRNHLTHEYPDHPEITAEFLNKTYTLSSPLIELTNKIIKALQ